MFRLIQWTSLLDIEVKSALEAHEEAMCTKAVLVDVCGNCLLHFQMTTFLQEDVFVQILIVYSYVSIMFGVDKYKAPTDFEDLLQ